MDDVAGVFNDDLTRRAADPCFDLARLDEPDLRATLAEVYPEATPVGAVRSVFEALA